MTRLARYVCVALLVFSGGTFVLAGAHAVWRGVTLGILGQRVEGRVVTADTPCPHAPGACVEFMYTDRDGATRGTLGQWPLALGRHDPGDPVTVRFRGEDDAELASAVWVGTVLGLMAATAGALALRVARDWARGNHRA